MGVLGGRERIGGSGARGGPEQDSDWVGWAGNAICGGG